MGAGRREKPRENDLFFWGGKNYPKKIFFFCIYLLVMPKYWVKNYFAHGRFPEVGQKQKTEKKKRERERERAKVGDNNGQATHGARKHAWRTQAAWAKIVLKAQSTLTMLRIWIV